MSIERRDNIDLECDRLRKVALPELEGVDWFHAVGAASDIPNEFAIWERDEARGLGGFEEYRSKKRFYGQVCSHVDVLFPRPFGVRFTDSVFEDLIAVYDTHSDPINEKIVAAGQRFSWWTMWTERSAIFDAKYYAASRAFELTDRIREPVPIPDYYFQAFRLYKAGRFPCGWTRKLDGPGNRWKKGRFICI